MTHINFVEVQATYSLKSRTDMLEIWSRLHAGDQEPVPASDALADAWLQFHQGDFLAAAEQAASLSHGLPLQLKALATYAHYLETDATQKVARFKQVVTLAEAALQSSERELANVHYQIAYSLGRYGQFISVARALKEGIAGQIADSLQRTLALVPDHADAHTALATYQAEIIGKLGKLAAKLTYNASAADAERLYARAVELAPYSVSAKTEYADGLLTLYGQKKLSAARALYEAAVQNAPADALEALDYSLAKQELADA